MAATTETKVVRFTRTRNNGTDVCASCNVRTWKDRIDASTGLCEACYEEAGLENEHSDGHHEVNPNPECPDCKEVAMVTVEALVPTKLADCGGYEVVRSDGVVVGTYDNALDASTKLEMLRKSDDTAQYRARPVHKDTPLGQELLAQKRAALAAIAGENPMVTETKSKAQAKREVAAEAKAAAKAQAEQSKAQAKAEKDAARAAKAAQPKAEKAPKREAIIQTFPGRADAFITRRNQVSGHECGLCHQAIGVNQTYERLQKSGPANEVAGFTLPKGQVHFHTDCVKDVATGIRLAEQAAAAKASKAPTAPTPKAEKAEKAPKAPRKPKAAPASETSENGVVAEAEAIAELTNEPVE